MRLDELVSLCEKEENAQKFALDTNLIDKCIFCKNGHPPILMNLNKYKKSKHNLIWKCRKCEKSTSILSKSIFSHSKLSISKVLQIIYFWSHNHTVKATSHETSVSEQTISAIFRQIKHACFLIMQTEKETQIGGPNTIVEIDETLITKRKYNQGRVLSENWVFGGICRQTKEIFIESVPDRKATTLIPLIEKHIKTGTTIHSDKWTSYNLLDQEPYSQKYDHKSVNHKENFIDPISGANTQLIERSWRDFKEKKKISQGIPRTDIELYIAEFIWRKRIRNQNKDPFHSACEFISMISFE